MPPVAREDGIFSFSGLFVRVHRKRVVTAEVTDSSAGVIVVVPAMFQRAKLS